MRIVNKTKFIRTVTLLGILLSMIIIFSSSTYSKGEVDYKIEYICRGETLWSIAENEMQNNKYFEKKDIRYVINQIQDINNLYNVNLTQGMQIKIPIYK